MNGRWLAYLAAATAVSPAGAGADSFDTIRYWVGEGARRAALVIDWDESPGTGTPLVWGYRWDRSATGEDLLRAVLEADQRLFAKLSAPGPLGVAVFGLGYDANADAQFQLTDDTPFGADGVAVTGPSDLAGSVDPLDLYAEGWESSGYWHYAVAQGAAARGAWATAPAGFTDRPLADGSWDAWTFSPSFALAGVFPDDPTAAPDPAATGDYNADGRVDAADYTTWRDSLGIASPVAGALADGDRSRLIDTADLAVWRANYGLNRNAPRGRAIPEPAAAFPALAVLLLVCLHPESDS